MKKKQITSFTLDASVLAELAGRSGNGQSRSGRINADLARYYESLKRARSALRSRFNAGELSAIADVCNGTWYEPHAIPLLYASVEDALGDGLAQKWSIDGATLVAKLREISYTEAAALVDAAERYWQAVGSGEQPDPASLLD